ncbi:PITH domain-containing protein 1-like isoform X2 [Patiria miniata]|uniref:PITH domain-containing protein n=1 Tax=Patiria miniata TaxID=46514 RepID=A0A914A0L1_PATMI|nr:PITH domain-containing protein 1-like isoform X2 [Patiria miniata]
MSGHGHSHGGCSGGHDHDPPDRGTEFSLYTKIDTDRVECLNEVTNGSGKLVFKPWDQRLDTEKYVESDDDEELLFNIPYKNQPNMTFDDTRSDPDQVFEMQRDTSGILEYNTKIARFSNVNHLSIHFSKNFGAETSIVYYIGLRGEFTEAQRQGIMIAQYEAYANPKDHKTSLFDNVQHEIS